MQRDNDNDLPVPDPDGSPIHPKELDAAERRMLDEVHREEPPAFQEPNGDLQAAHAAIVRQNGREMTEDEATAYRLASENMLDWLGDETTLEDVQKLERWENHLDWLDVSEHPPAPAPDDERWPEPERNPG